VNWIYLVQVCDQRREHADVVMNLLVQLNDLINLYQTAGVTSEKICTIQGVPGGKDLTSGECSLGQTIPI